MFNLQMRKLCSAKMSDFFKTHRDRDAARLNLVLIYDYLCISSELALSHKNVNDIQTFIHSFMYLLNLFYLPTAVKSPRDTKINSCLLSRGSQTFEQHFTSYSIILTKMIQASLLPLQCIIISFICTQRNLITRLRS